MIDHSYWGNIGRPLNDITEVEGLQAALSALRQAEANLKVAQEEVNLAMGSIEDILERFHE